MQSIHPCANHLPVGPFSFYYLSLSSLLSCQQTPSSYANHPPPPPPLSPPLSHFPIIFPPKTSAQNYLFPVSLRPVCEPQLDRQNVILLGDISSKPGLQPPTPMTPPPWWPAQSTFAKLGWAPCPKMGDSSTLTSPCFGFFFIIILIFFGGDCDEVLLSVEPGLGGCSCSSGRREESEEVLTLSQALRLSSIFVSCSWSRILWGKSVGTRLEKPPVGD